MPQNSFRLPGQTWEKSAPIHPGKPLRPCTGNAYIRKQQISKRGFAKVPGFRKQFFGSTWNGLELFFFCIPNSPFPPKIRSFLKPKREGSDWHCRSSCWPSLTIRPGHPSGEEKGDGHQISIQSSRPSINCLSVLFFLQIQFLICPSSKSELPASTMVTIFR